MTSPSTLPGPVRVMGTFFKKLTSTAPDGATLPQHIFSSLRIALGGWAMGVVIGTPLYNYTLMPTHMRCMFSVEEMKTATMTDGFSFTKGSPTMRICAKEDSTGDTAIKFSLGTNLYDLETDPFQNHPIHNPEVERRMIDAMIDLMEQNDAPAEQYTRLNLTKAVVH